MKMQSSKSFGRKREEWSYTKNLSSSDKISSDTVLKRRKVNKALTIFRDLSHKLYCEYKSNQPVKLKAKLRALAEATRFMKAKRQWENTGKRLGHVDGIEVGDQFQYRAELIVIGLHQQHCCGIDYLGKGENSLATSIVVTHRYANVMKSSGCLLYEGHGGNPNIRDSVAPHDQKLARGNLALWNSMNAGSPVRVILQVSEKCEVMEELSNNVSYSYIYDGLYFVDNVTRVRGQFGKLVFKFVLKKMSNQPASVSPGDVMESKTFVKRQKSKGLVLSKEVVRINDISEGKEKLPIRVVTPVSYVEIPKPFGYLVNMTYPKMNRSMLGGGCNCANACVDCLECVCIAKNGGTLAYDGNRKLVSPMKSSFIYECGSSCLCSSSCINRVSQSGIHFQLEIFKTKSKGWGVRTRSFIPSGSFVCELIGEVVHLNNQKVGSNLHVDDYIINIGASGKGCIDATRHGNIGRFINHSCSPNLCVKDVMYDHSDKSLPHKMLFATKDIPAGRELSYDYNCCKVNFKVLSKICYCGSLECNGQIYIEGQRYDGRLMKNLDFKNQQLGCI
ncbi:histone-lysine N-methyltransferase, H3 lysine-9 specific SUVH5 [Medicago truncatula]|nr:histone-lysine N-methyltransferase, H3 lysine-9 specific SUVH5 [Medicago truncatula]